MKLRYGALKDMRDTWEFHRSRVSLPGSWASIAALPGDLRAVREAEDLPSSVSLQMPARFLEVQQCST